MMVGGGGGESRAQADCDTRRNTGHPQHPKPMRMEKGKTTGSETERETVRQEQRYIPTRLGQLKCRLGNGENGAGSEEDSRTSRQRERESERAKERARSAKGGGEAVTGPQMPEKEGRKWKGTGRIKNNNGG